MSELLQTEGGEMGVEYDAEIVDPNEATEPTEPSPPDDPAPATSAAKMTRAMWQAMKLSERVQRSGVITQPEIAEVLGISPSHARNLARSVESGTQRIDGRSGVSYNALIDMLYERRTKDSYAWARKLETMLGVRKRARPIHVVTADDTEEVASGGGD